MNRWFNHLSNQYILVAVTAIVMLALAFMTIRSYAPHTLSCFSSRLQQTPTPSPFSIPPSPTSTSTSALPSSSAAGEADFQQDPRSQALLAELKPSALLSTPGGAVNLIREAETFLLTVQKESDLDARPDWVRGAVPAIARPEDGDWLSLILPIEYPWTTVEKLVPILEESGRDVVGYAVQFASAEGPRSAMEDEHIAATLRHPGVVDAIGLVGVFDGHGGSKASEFVKENIVAYLSREFQANAESASMQSNEQIYASCILALNNAFIKLDEAFSREIEPLFNAPYADGTTAIVGLIVHDKVIVANLGDSRAIVIRNGQPIPMSVDAEPTIARYGDQVRALGGVVEENRVLGIATPAAIGDHYIVPRENSIAGRKCLINIPEITIFDYQSGDKIVMACDGLWDALSSNMVAEVITQRPGLDVVPAEISDAVLLTRQALMTPGQYDNVTVAIVDLSASS